MNPTRGRLGTASRQIVDLYDRKEYSKAEPHFHALVKRYQETGDSSEILWLVQACKMARLDPRRYSVSELDEIEINTMEAVHSGLAGKRQDGSFRGWVRQIARNQAYRLIQDKEGQRTRVAFEIERRIERSFRFSSLISSEGDVARALTLLRPEHAEVIRLWVRNGHNAAEVARRLDERESTVKSRLARGLEQLRSILESPGYRSGN